MEAASWNNAELNTVSSPTYPSINNEFPQLLMFLTSSPVCRKAVFLNLNLNNCTAYLLLKNVFLKVFSRETIEKLIVGRDLTGFYDFINELSAILFPLCKIYMRKRAGDQKKVVRQYF